jgi:hypothetical protein
MKEDTRRITRIADAIYDGRASIGYSVESDSAAGGFDAFDGDDKPLGTFATRAEARTAIIHAADHPEEVASS